jgi:tRNA U34 5-carboxymethylaminomethyl modifying GTPase MnmE/TrmE
MLAQTTITAIATPPGRGGVGVIRLSGPKAFTIAEALTKKILPEPRMAGFRQFYDAAGEVMDEGLVLCFLIRIHLRAKMWWSYKDMAALSFKMRYWHVYLN